MIAYSRRVVILEDSWKITTTNDLSSATVIIPVEDYTNTALEDALESMFTERFRIYKCADLITEIKHFIKSQDKEDAEYAINEDPRTLQIKSTTKALFIKICGKAPQEGIDGHISEHHFTYKTIPGEIGKDGKIDFTDIKKYPSAKLHFIICYTKQR